MSDLPSAPALRFDLPGAPTVVPGLDLTVDEPEQARDLRCPWCYKWHPGAECGHIIEIEFYESGALKRAVLDGPRQSVIDNALDEMPNVPG